MWEAASAKGLAGTNLVSWRNSKEVSVTAVE